MDQGLEQDNEISLNGQQPAWKEPPGDREVIHVAETDVDAGKWHGLRGLLIAQIFGQFNDQAWKQLVILLAMAAVVGEAEKQERTAIVTMMLLIPLTIVSLPAGVLADRVSKRSVIVAMKVLELVLMLAGAAALFIQPAGGLAGDRRCWVCSESRLRSSCRPSMGSCPRSCLTSGSPPATACSEMTSNLAMLAGIVGGGIIL